MASFFQSFLGATVYTRNFTAANQNITDYTCPPGRIALVYPFRFRGTGTGGQFLDTTITTAMANNTTTQMRYGITANAAANASVNLDTNGANTTAPLILTAGESLVLSRTQTNINGAHASATNFIQYSVYEFAVGNN
ncbi:MAG: hypothetical protein J7501_09100 [Bdellovibrio sp.]|nr:hypothetical protein [Bdellovibrio sp.]